MSTINLAYGRDKEATVKDLFGNNVQIGLRGDGAVILSLRNDGRNSDNSNKPLEQDVVIAFTAEQTEAIAKELLRLQPQG